MQLRDGSSHSVEDPYDVSVVSVVIELATNQAHKILRRASG
jgi:hypothetical protein